MISDVLDWMSQETNIRLLHSLPVMRFIALEEHSGFYNRFGRPGKRGPSWTLLLTLPPIRGGEWSTGVDPISFSLATVYYLTSASVNVGHIIYTPRGVVRVDDNHVSVLSASGSRQESFTGVTPVLDSGNMLAFASGEDAMLFAVKQQRYVELR